MIVDEGGGGQRPDFLFREYGASAVVFHGSRLFGDPYPDSDIDLLEVFVPICFLILIIGPEFASIVRRVKRV